MALYLKAAVVPLAESLQRWAALLAPLLEGWKHTRSPSRELHLPGKSLLFLLFLEAAFYRGYRSHPSSVPPSARQQICSCLSRRRRGNARVAQQISCRDLFMLPFPSCIILDLADSSVGSPLGGVGPWLSDCSTINTKPGAFSDFSFWLVLKAFLKNEIKATLCICRDIGKYPCIGTESNYLRLQILSSFSIRLKYQK